MPMATLGSQMRAVNKVSLYYNDWKVLNESSRLAELQRRCPPRGNCQTAICQHSALVPIYLSALPEMISKLPVLPGVLRWPQVSLGLSCGTGQGEGLLQQQEVWHFAALWAANLLPGDCGGTKNMGRV